MKVLLVGGYPPPYGGVAVHTRRLADCLRGWGAGCQVLTWQPRPVTGNEQTPGYVWREGNPFRYLVRLCTAEADVIHDHSFIYFLAVPFVPVLAYCLVRMATRRRWRRTVLSVHSGVFPADLRRANGIRRALFCALLRRVPIIICDSPALRDGMVDLGIPTDRLLVVDPFLPFQVNGSAPRRAAELGVFLADHQPLVLTSGYTFSATYRYEVVVRLVARLRREWPRIGLLMAVSSYLAEPERRVRIEELIREDLLEDVIHIATDLPDLASLLPRVDLLVRASATDGNPLSVKEALYLGVPVLATGVCVRPPGCHLFDLEDEEGLYRTATDLLRMGRGTTRDLTMEAQAAANFERILAVYRRVAGPW